MRRRNSKGVLTGGQMWKKRSPTLSALREHPPINVDEVVRGLKTTITDYGHCLFANLEEECERSILELNLWTLVSFI